jgi:alpha-mannosidase
VRFKTDVENGRTIADAAFGLVERQLLTVSEEEARMERPVATAPLHRYVSLFTKRVGATLFADGLTEYETDSGTFAVTVLRSVGELSRGELRERPGNAGWPAPTPEAQGLGYFEGTLSLMLHGPRTPEVVDEIERAADDILVPLIGETLRSALHTPPPVHGAALEGRGLSFSCAKESDNGEWLVLRCVNLLEEQVKGSWRLGRTVREAHMARLDETPLTRLKTRDDTISFVAPPRGVVTILVK